MEWNEQYKKELEIIKLKRDELKKQNINELKARGYEMGMKIQLENGNESPFKNWKKKYLKLKIKVQLETPCLLEVRVPF